MFSGDIAIDVAVLPTFVLAVVVLMVVPGPDMVFVVATGLSDGRRAATRAACGITAGVAVYVVLTALGLGVVLATAPGLIEVIQVLGALYLAYLAWTTWRSGGSPLDGTAASPRIFRRGFVVNLSNPKIVLFFAAFLPQFLGDARDHPALQLLMLGLVLQAVGFVADLAIGWAAGSVRDRVLDRPRTRTALGRAGAVVYGGLAAVLLVDAAR